MVYKKKDLLVTDRETLIQIIEDLQKRLKEKNATLKVTRTKLSVAKERVHKMRNTVKFQRERIIQLYN